MAVWPLVVLCTDRVAFRSLADQAACIRWPRGVLVAAICFFYLDDDLPFTLATCGLAFVARNTPFDLDLVDLLAVRNLKQRPSSVGSRSRSPGELILVECQAYLFQQRDMLAMVGTVEV